MLCGGGGYQNLFFKVVVNYVVGRLMMMMRPHWEVRWGDG